MTKETIEILYNPRCSKCRGALALLQEKQNVEIHIREYLKDPLNEEEIRELLKLVEPLSLIRQKESDFDPWRNQGEPLTEEQVLQILLQHPHLLERPIVIRGDAGVIARPPEQLETLFT
jgi:arsenate reductase (glutaredoxin)